MSMKNQMKILSMLAMAEMMNPTQRQFDVDEKPNIEIQPKPPGGTKEYFFNSLGEFSTTKMLKTECVFICYAINDKNAKRKFAKWKKSNCT